MTQTENPVEALEKRRKQARRAYLFLGLSLLGMIAVSVLVMPAFGLGAAGVIAVLYLGFWRRDIKEYRDAYTKERLLSGAGKYLTSPNYQRSGGTDLRAIAQTGIMPMNNTNGVIRHVVCGAWRERTVRLSDVSYVFETTDAHGHMRALPISGCFMQMELPDPPGFSLACCPASLSDAPETEAFYHQRGYTERFQADHAAFTAFIRPQCAPVSAAVCAALQSVWQKTGGDMGLNIDGRLLGAFFPHCYLAQGEPDYKHPVTADQLQTDLWMLTELIKIAKALTI